ncbi:MAG: IPT/TIG domain-containing protein [Acidobacteriia bacterium]|nr:IPT/TIG domain-containing protein [Terriglobia bacterium]
MATHFRFHRSAVTEVKSNPLTTVHTGRRQPTLPLLIRGFWPVVYALILVLLLLTFLVELARAGGPHYVAGTSYFDPATKGTAVTWARGAVTYYTDQGDLGPLLPQASADAFVADAFSRWTSIPMAAVSATRAGHLAEDVSGANVIVNIDGSISMPSDILPGAVGTPVGIVYDADGKVIDALLGLGAGGSDYCFTNAVVGGPDNLSPSANFLHALVILNGNCAQTNNQLADLKYRIVRLLGRVLGLDWSQVNLNVQTRNPVPAPEDYAGFSIMHALDLVSCVPISACYANADQPKMDDRAALARLYPVTAQNQSNFPSKQLFSENTIRIHGSVRFMDASGQPAQSMQGVNVVARWVDPATGKASRTTAASAVSGSLFCGNAGNPVNGLTDSSGQPFNQYGSDDPTVEGFFDLAGLEIPNGANSAQYQLSVEALDPFWSQAVGPYGPWQVQPSGAAQPILVTVSAGGDLQQDILMSASAADTQDAFGPQGYATPAPVPTPGYWLGTLSGYGNADYFWFTGQNYRTMSVEVTALDAAGTPSQDKALPVIGIWALADPEGTIAPAQTPLAFNSSTFGMSRLDAILLANGSFRIGISDYRGDGRPDFRYQARVLYGDSVTPVRASVGGGTALAIKGIGFRSGNTVSVANLATPGLALSPNQIIVTAPALADGIQNVMLNDPVTGSASVMSNVLTYGAGPTDMIKLIAGTNPQTPVGAEAANPIRIGAYTYDGSTPVGGASVALSAIPAVAFAACGGASSCTLLTDESGEVSTRVTVLAAGTMTITAQLAPASYTPAKSVQTTLQGTSSALDFALAAPYAFVAQGATLDASISGRVLANGVPLSGRTVNFQVAKGAGTLSAANANTDVNGYANTSLHLSALASDVQVSACVQPGSTPCQSFYVTAVPNSQLALEAVANTVQVMPVGHNFQPVTVRVTDSALVPNPVRGATVVFQSLVGRWTHASPIQWTVGDTVITRTPMPVILSSSQVSVPSDANGLATLQPSTGGIAGAVEIQGTATTGVSTLPFELQSFAAAQDALRDVTVHRDSAPCEHRNSALCW